MAHGAVRALDTMPSGIGALINKDIAQYTLRKYIGAGTNGYVFEADQRAADTTLKQVAIKLIPFRGDDPHGIDELKSASHLDNPYIVECFTAGGPVTFGQQQYLYLAMELATETLGDRIGRGPLTSHEALVLADHIGRGLVYLHGREETGHVGHAHRDIKPRNILWCGKAWKVSDLGSLRLLPNGRTVPAHIVGATPRYMPREAITHQVSPAWDMWSLGMTILDALRGGPPISNAFWFDNPQATEEWFAAVKAARESALGADTMSTPLRMIINGCLTENRRVRLTAQEIVAITEQALADRRVPTPRARAYWRGGIVLGVTGIVLSVIVIRNRDIIPSSSPHLLPSISVPRGDISIPSLNGTGEQIERIVSGPPAADVPSVDKGSRVHDLNRQSGPGDSSGVGNNGGGGDRAADFGLARGVPPTGVAPPAPAGRSADQSATPAGTRSAGGNQMAGESTAADSSPFKNGSGVVGETGAGGGSPPAPESGSAGESTTAISTAPPTGGGGSAGEAVPAATVTRGETSAGQNTTPAKELLDDRDKRQITGLFEQYGKGYNAWYQRQDLRSIQDSYPDATKNTAFSRRPPKCASVDLTFESINATAQYTDGGVLVQTTGRYGCVPRISAPRTEDVAVEKFHLEKRHDRWVIVASIQEREVTSK